MNSMNNTKRLQYLSKKKVIKTFQNKNVYSEGAYLLNNFIVAKSLKKDMNGYTFWKNEINSLMKVIHNKHFPHIIAADPNRLIIYMTYCGESLEKIRHLPINWREQFIEIKNALIRKHLNPNDILPRNICILDDTIKIIDFGLANTRYNELMNSIRKLNYTLNKYA